MYVYIVAPHDSWPNGSLPAKNSTGPVVRLEPIVLIRVNTVPESEIAFTPKIALLPDEITNTISIAHKTLPWIKAKLHYSQEKGKV